MQVVPHKCPCVCNVDVSIHLPCAEGVTAGQGHLMWNRWNRAAPARQRRLWWSRSVPTTLLTCTNASMCERSWVVVVRGSVNAWRRPIMLLHFCIYFTLITGKLLPISIFAVVGRVHGRHHHRPNVCVVDSAYFSENPPTTNSAREFNRQAVQETRLRATPCVATGTIFSFLGMVMVVSQARLWYSEAGGWIGVRWRMG